MRRYVLLLLGAILSYGAQGYKVGVGIADMTGPTAEVAFMGYANPEQRGTGLHLRQFSRSFIIDDGTSRIVFSTNDCGMMGTGVRKHVLAKLAEEFGDLYNEQNVMLSGTHTHSTPGGFLMDIMFDLNTWGFVQQTFDAYVDGIVRSITNAHNNMVDDARIFVSRGEIMNANINRSPTAYLHNPEEERARYQYDVDKTFTQLKFRRSDGSALGVVTWFAVHATSMNNTNKLVSSDNVGLASTLFEKRVNGKTIVGKGPFVAAFASTNLGDVSPNIAGPRCVPSGDPCDIYTSSCSKSGDKCIASGPGKDMKESTFIIANRILEDAWKAYQGEEEEITGPIMSVHQYVHMPSQEVNYTDPFTGVNATVKGCVPAMGYSFAAGTTDGPGMFNFEQSTKSTNPLWNIVTDILAKPTQEQIDCQAPKPILISSGEINFPFEWQPSIVSTQLALVGGLAIACMPGELTTMSGRRMRAALADTFGFSSPASVVVAGLCNTYSDYIATPHEYQAQRYEGASTIFGPHTLTIYIEQYKKLARALLEGTRPDAGPEPPMSFNKLFSLLPGVVFDSAGMRRNYGDVLAHPQPTASPGETVTATFVSGHPRNGLLQEGTFLTVEYQDNNTISEQNNTWKIVATDANWETQFVWRRVSSFVGTSEVDVHWTIPEDAEPGTYRIRHFGHYKHLFGSITPYQGTSNTFQVIPSNPTYRPERTYDF